jgi:hypothetical protein
LLPYASPTGYCGDSGSIARAFERALEIDPRSVDAKIGLATALSEGVANGLSRSREQDKPAPESMYPTARTVVLHGRAIESSASKSILHPANFPERSCT